MNYVKAHSEIYKHMLNSLDYNNNKKTQHSSNLIFYYAWTGNPMRQHGIVCKRVH